MSFAGHGGKFKYMTLTTMNGRNTLDTMADGVANLPGHLIKSVSKFSRRNTKISQSQFEYERTISRAEKIIIESLQAVLNSANIEDSPEFCNILSALEYFIPEVLKEIHPEWTYEGLDGLYPLNTEKTGDRMMSLFGQAILISDQSIVPVHIGMQANPQGNKLDWFECLIGSKNENGMIRTPYRSPENRIKMLQSLEGKKDIINWAYQVTFGKITDNRNLKVKNTK